MGIPHSAVVIRRFWRATDDGSGGMRREPVQNGDRFAVSHASRYRLVLTAVSGTHADYDRIDVRTVQHGD